MTKVYIAGPMTNIPEFNFPAFMAAAGKYRDLGWEVVNPAEHDIEAGFDPSGLNGEPAEAEAQGFVLADALLWDLHQVADSDGIVLLPGWSRSSGAKAEVSLAAALGKWALEDEFGGEPIAAKSLVGGFGRPKAATLSEVRVTNTTTGAQKGSKDERFDLIPPGPLTDLARHYGIGSRKYADRNWEKGNEWHLHYAAMQRHANQFWAGEDHDGETGSKHVIAVAWHALALAEFMETHPELDTRPKAVTP